MINITATRSNVVPRLTRKDEMQEIPTPQGFLVIQICVAIMRSMHATAVADRQSTRKIVAFRRVNQAVKKICVVGPKMPLARSDPTRIEQIGPELIRFRVTRRGRFSST